MAVNAALYAVSALLALAIPAVSVLYMKKKFGAKTKDFFSGVIIYIIFYVFIYAVATVLLSMYTDIFKNLEDSPTTEKVIDIIIRAVCVVIGYYAWFKLIFKKDDQTGALMTGVGFGSSVIFMVYALPGIVNTVLSIMLINNPDLANVDTIVKDPVGGDGFRLLTVFENNLVEVLQSDLLNIFFGVLQMICYFVLETAVAYICYRVFVCENGKKWLFAALLLNVSGHSVTFIGENMEHYWVVIILIIITILASGAAYSLYKPFVPKKEED